MEKYFSFGETTLYQLTGTDVPRIIAAASSGEAAIIAAHYQRCEPEEVKGLRRLTPMAIRDVDWRNVKISTLRYKNSYLLPEHRVGAKFDSDREAAEQATERKRRTA